MELLTLGMIILFASIASVQGAAGPDCVECHSDTNLTTDSNYTQNITAHNLTGAIHQTLNNDTGTSLNFSNQRCWECHLTGSEPAGDSLHTDGRNTSYNCTDSGCHVVILQEIESGYKNASGGYAMMDDSNNLAPNGSNMTHKRDTIVDGYGGSLVADKYARHANPNSSGWWVGTSTTMRDDDPNQICVNCHSIDIATEPSICDTCHFLNSNGTLVVQHDLRVPECVDCHGVGEIVDPKVHVFNGSTQGFIVNITDPPKNYFWAPLGGYAINDNYSIGGNDGGDVVDLLGNSVHNELYSNCTICHSGSTFEYNETTEEITSVNYSGAHTWNSRPDCTMCHNITGPSTQYEAKSIEDHSQFVALSEGNNTQCLESCHNNSNRYFASYQPYPLPRGHAHDAQVSTYAPPGNLSVGEDQYILYNNWETDTNFSTIDAGTTNDVWYTNYNYSSGIWESYKSGLSYNSGNDVKANDSVFIFYDSLTLIPITVNQSSVTIVPNVWHYTFLPGTLSKTLTDIETSMNGDGVAVSALYAWNVTNQAYTITGSETISVNQGLIVYCTIGGEWTP